MDQVLKERYELSMARIGRFEEEETVKEPFREYFKKTAAFIGLCGQVMDAYESGELKNWEKERLAS